jgi:HemY protein
VKVLFWIIAIFALAAGLVVVARYNEGYVLIVLPPWRVELALNLLVLLLIAAVALLYTAVRLVSRAVMLPSRVREYRLARRRERARSALAIALEAYFEGRYPKAERAAVEAGELGENLRLSATIAARAAHGLRAYARRDAYLQQVASVAPEDDALRIITESEFLLDERRAQEALQALKALPVKHTAALRLELRATQQLKQWDQVARAADELEARGVLDSEQAAKLRAHATAESLARKSTDAHALDEAWRKLSEAEKRQTPVALAAARCHVALSRGAEAQRVIEQSLDEAWDSDLVALYSECVGDTVRQIERAEKWLEAHPGDHALLLTLGRLCARAALWGKAETYLEASLSVEPTWQAYLELARLNEKLGNTEAAQRCYRRTLDVALERLRHPPERSPTL